MRKMEELIKENLESGKVLDSRLRGIHTDPGATSTPAGSPRTNIALPHINESSLTSRYEESALGKGAGTLLTSVRERSSSDLDFKTKTGSRVVQLKIEIQAAIANARREYEGDDPHWLDKFEDAVAEFNSEITDTEQECLYREITDFYTQVTDLQDLIIATLEEFKVLYADQQTLKTHSIINMSQHNDETLSNSDESSDDDPTGDPPKEPPDGDPPEDLPEDQGNDGFGSNKDHNDGNDDKQDDDDDDKSENLENESEEMVLDQHIKVLHEKVDSAHERLDNLGDLSSIITEVKNQYTSVDEDQTSLKRDIKLNKGNVQSIKTNLKKESDTNKIKFKELEDKLNHQQKLISMINKQLRNVSSNQTTRSTRQLEDELDHVRRSLNKSIESNAFGNGSGSNLNSAGLTKMYSSRIDKYIGCITRICQDNDVSAENLANRVVIDYHNNVLPDLSKYIKDAESALTSYMQAGGDDIRKINAVDLATATGQSWSDKTKQLYRSKELHLRSSSKTQAEFIPKFTADGKTTVYEFLKSINEHTQDDHTTLQKARLLVSKLSDSIKMDVTTFGDSFQQVESHLIKKYGQIRDIVISKVSVIKSTKHPNNQSITSLIDYYKKIFLTLKQVENLHTTGQLPAQRLQEYIYKTDFVVDLLGSLHKTIHTKYLDKMVEKGQTFSDLNGKDAFDLLLQICQDMCARLELKKQLPGVDQFTDGVNGDKTKRSREHRESAGKASINNADALQPDHDHGYHKDSDHLSDSPDSRSSDNPKLSKVKSPKSSNHTSSAGKKPKHKDRPKRNHWYDQTLKFPCPIGAHIDDPHEIGTCEQFFSLSARAKRADGYQKLCWTCMGPRDQCFPSCENVKKMPSSLICSDCKENVKSTQRSPLNILMCTNDEHAKPKVDELATDLAKWFPGFKKTDMIDSVKHHALLVAVTQACTCGNNKVACNCSAPESLTRQPVDDDITPCFNTETGEVLDNIDGDSIVREVIQDSLYIMQMLNFNGEECLTFYDGGSNQHLMEGALAEKLNLKVITPENMSLGTVGKNRIWTNYGIYSMLMGPDSEGDYHEMVVQGITAITEPFQKYNLNSINKEIRRTGRLPSGCALPESIGGMDVKLLVGIKDASISPVPVFCLANGLGVFESEFTDIYGSRYCYGGPHQLFTQINKSGHGSFNFIRCFLAEMAGAYQKSIYSSLQFTFTDKSPDVDISDISDESTKPSTITGPYMSADVDCMLPIIEPTSLSSEDFLDAGCPDPYIVSKRLDIVSGIGDQCPENKPRPCETKRDYQCNYCSLFPVTTQDCFKAFIPLSKSKGLMDEQDIDNVIDYRCPKCSKCLECKESNKLKTQSLQEKREQEIIENSVHVDLEAGKVSVDLPFITDPIASLTKRHKGDNNHYQALRCYKAQCRKSPKIKEDIRKVHQDLVDKNFMVKLSELPQAQQDLIRDALFKHYFTWKGVPKVSISTPLRFVVDPSITGLNQTLAKGTNHLNKITSIIIRARCKLFVWTADVSKLYNCLHLTDSALPFCLFLYHHSLDEDVNPEVWVMMRAWYGVVSSGNQSSCGMCEVCSLQAEEKPEALPVVRDDTYVDDTFSGEMTEDLVNTQITNTQSALGAGGFHFKYIVRSGMDPPEKASTDGVSVPVLGHKWVSKDDVLHLGFQEINFNKKIQGAKKDNPFPVETAEDVAKLASSTNPITRTTVISKLAEIWDPTGLFEPYKLQLKLEAMELNGVDWNSPLDKSQQEHWIGRFKEFVQLPYLIAPRCVIPSDALNPDQIRLLCLADAAVSAGGAAIYAGYLLKDGSYSSQLLTSKSKVLKMSIPRNELSAILELAKLTYSVNKALGDLVSEVRYFTDSTIALCWICNTSKKLRMFTFNRVEEIRRCMEWTVGSIEDDVPLYHIDGESNVADLLTKSSDLLPSDLGPASRWQKGDSWMTLPFNQMPITRYKDLTIAEREDVIVDSECFKDIEIAVASGPTSNMLDGRPSFKQLSHCMTCMQKTQSCQPWNSCYGSHIENGHCDGCTCKIVHTSLLSKAGGSGDDRYMVNIVKLGWIKSINVIKNVLKFSHAYIHRAHSKLSMSESLASKLSQICLVCRCKEKLPDPEHNSGPTVHVTTRSRAKENSLKLVTHDYTLAVAALNYLFKIASTEVTEHFGKTKINQMFKTDEKGIIVYTGRLSKEDPISSFDLDFHTFFDGHEIKSVVPVVLPTSKIFYTYLMYVHHRLRPHSGVESTLREVMKIMHVPNARPMISRIRKDCTKCKILAKKTVDLHMENHHSGRTTLAPPFYNIQMDIAMSFKAKPHMTSRTRIDCHCLVMVCMMSGATSLHVMEDLKAHSVISCLERHSSRYGIPHGVFVDSGTQLVKLIDAEFSLREVNLVTYDSLGFIVEVGTPKSHEERGRAESKVKALKVMLKKLSVTTQVCQTMIAWETSFQKIANQLDNLPIAKSVSTSLYDQSSEILTANRLKLGRNNFRSPEGNMLLTNSPSSLLERSRLVNEQWYSIFKDWIHHLIPKPKWFKSELVRVGDICLFLYEDGNQPKLWVWKLGKVVSMPTKRKLTIGYFIPSSDKIKTVLRCPRQISIIFSETDLAINTTSHFERLVAESK